LGINLSSTFKKKSKEEEEKEKAKLLPNRTMFTIVVGKMVVMPIIGIISTWFLQRYYIDFPDAIDSTCYLVMMIVFITPTANNVMVMVELSGSSSKEGMARVIGYQYLVSPVILSIVLAVVVSLANCHFDASPVCAM
jgi:predicted permease